MGRLIHMRMYIPGAVKRLRGSRPDAMSGMLLDDGRELTNREAADRLEFDHKAHGHLYVQMCDCADFDPVAGDCGHNLAGRPADCPCTGPVDCEACRA